VNTKPDGPGGWPREHTNIPTLEEVALAKVKRHVVSDCFKHEYEELARLGRLKGLRDTSSGEST